MGSRQARFDLTSIHTWKRLSLGQHWEPRSHTPDGRGPVWYQRWYICYFVVKFSFCCQAIGCFFSQSNASVAQYMRRHHVVYETLSHSRGSDKRRGGMLEQTSRRARITFENSQNPQLFPYFDASHLVLIILPHAQERKTWSPMGRLYKVEWVIFPNLKSSPSGCGYTYQPRINSLKSLAPRTESLLGDLAKLDYIVMFRI